MNLLLVEDDALLASTLRDALIDSGHQVQYLGDGDAAYATLQNGHHFQLILLDLNLPGRTGLEVLEVLRQHDRDTPVLILTARAAIEDRVKGLDLGADDYLAKPFSLEELEARIRALLRRSGSTTQLNIGSLGFDSLAQRFTLNAEPLALPPREQRLLAYLMRHAGQPVDKATLVEQAFGDDDAVGDNAIEVYIHRLRKRLAGHDISLRTVRGLGYVLETS
ncbi:response regulator transcription factor [Halomonas binhaiensis]|uniref:Response regulator transcription factor n=1 Tax=Halomonas binhaiensis TaxID=2562282 RepID=A0A5C1NGM4_9GAMM|nr:response regulator transcription factor [Halomonas binhaiensis]QEM81588.1 response regulator transcription factor [Halomonas binhaiensis]